MCGIYGFAKKEGALNILERFRVRGVVMDLAFLNESRGKDGTGIALLSKESRILFKEATLSSKLLKTKRFQKVIGSITDKTQVCLGHTRFATIGDVRNSHCHPFESEDFIGVHNGHFMNREALLSKFGKTTQTAVDSEAIFRVLDGSLTTDDLVSRLGVMEGDFAIGFSFKRDSNRLFLIRGDDKPLHGAYLPRFRTLFWSSEKEHLEYALARNGMRGAVWAFQPNQLYTVDVRDFSCKTNIRKKACAMKSFERNWDMRYPEDDFERDRYANFFSYEELEEFGFFEGSGLDSRSKMHCASCAMEFETGELFYDDMSRRFLCEACSFDCLHLGDSPKAKAESGELFELSGV